MKRLMFLLLPLMVACGGAPKQSAQTKEVSSNQVQVLYFHGAQRCITCNAIEKLTREVVAGMGKDSVVLTVVDISEPQNQALADKYEVSWSSLIIDKGGKVENLTDMGFSYAKSAPDEFKVQLSDAITKILR